MSNEDDDFNPAVFAFGTIGGHRAGDKIGSGEIDATKRFILDMVSEDEWTKRKKIAGNMDLSQPVVRRHLGDLVEMGYLLERERGREKEYMKN